MRRPDAVSTESMPLSVRTTRLVKFSMVGSDMRMSGEASRSAVRAVDEHTMS